MGKYNIFHRKTCENPLLFERWRRIDNRISQGGSLPLLWQLLQLASYVGLGISIAKDSKRVPFDWDSFKGVVWLVNYLKLYLLSVSLVLFEVGYPLWCFPGTFHWPKARSSFFLEKVAASDFAESRLRGKKDRFFRFQLADQCHSFPSRFSGSVGTALATRLTKWSNRRSTCPLPCPFRRIDSIKN